MDELETERLQLLEENAKQRRREIMHYQINIDNYRRALEEIHANYSGDINMVEFAKQLQGLLNSSIIEQTKEKIMLTVIEKQLPINEA